MMVAASVSPIWPEPQTYIPGDKTIFVDPMKLTFVSSFQSHTLDKTIDRYRDLMFPHTFSSALPSDMISMNGINIHIESKDESLHLDTDQGYTLEINGETTTITVHSVYGVMYALESLSQLISFDFDMKLYTIKSTPLKVVDFPRFKHRGVLVDTSRHFQPVHVMTRMIRSFSYAKLNVMHWHIVDSQSFPVEVPSYPKLWAGSYSSEERYTTEDVKYLVEYARLRGVRVIPEFDVPGHAGSWCKGYPQICPSVSCLEPLDPTFNGTFKLLDGLWDSMTALFPDEFVHIGGDEVNTNCWTSTEHINSWLKKNNFSTSEGYLYFIKKVQGIVDSKSRSPINWEEVFLKFGNKLPKETIVHIWLSHATLAKVVKAGYRGILSNSDVWYLDHLQVTWEQFYLNEPFAGIDDPDEQKLVLGGETCMWGETVDPSDWDNTVWPRAAAGAERLWSARSVNDTVTALPRLENFRCLLTRRGISAAPVLNKDARTGAPNPNSCFRQ